MIKVCGEKLWQWDMGRSVEVAPNSGLEVESVHFALCGSDKALVVTPRKENGKVYASIPNELLTHGTHIACYLYFVGDEERKTIENAILSVARRAKPDDYVYTETEVRTWAELDARIDGKLDNQFFSGGEGAVLAIDEFGFVYPRDDSVFLMLKTRAIFSP